MSKLKLRVDDLEVQTFQTTTRTASRGTVQAHATAGGGCDVHDARGQSWTYGDSGCETSQYEDLCGCTNGGPDNTTCNVNLTCGVYGSCPYQTCMGQQDHTACTGG